MPIVAGQFQHWWNWSARDPENGRVCTFVTNGHGSVVTREQLRAHLAVPYAHLDFTDFSCELTDKLPQNVRKPVPLKFRMDRRQMELLKHLTGKAPLPLNPPTPNRSILYGPPIHQPEERGDRPPHRPVRRVSVLFG